MPSKPLTLSLFFIFLYSCTNIPQHITTGLEGRPLPAIDLLLPDSVTHINTRDATIGTPTVLIYVDPGCQFCKAELTELKSRITDIHGIQFYVFTSSSATQTRQLDRTFGLTGHRNLYLGIDTKKTFSDYFDPPGFPYIAVYRRDQKLQAVFLGKTDLDYIEKAANN